MMTNTAPKWLAISRVGIVAVFAAAMFIMVLSGAKTFELSYQAWDLWQGGDTPITAFAKFNPHAMRFVVYYPIFLLSQISALPVDMVFSLLCVLLLVGLCVTMNAIDAALGTRSWIRTLIYPLVFFGLALVMNGRLIFAFAGLALIILAFTDCASRHAWSVRNFLFLLGGLLLMSVSSGTLSVGALFAILACGLILARGDSLLARAKLGLFASVLITIAAFSISLTVGALQNLEYFGGGTSGLVAMLDHGLGRFFLRFGTLGVASVGVIAFCAATLSLGAAWRLPIRSALLVLALLPVALGGLYGISTLAVGIVPLVLALRPRLLLDIADVIGLPRAFRYRCSQPSPFEGPGGDVPR